MARVNIEEESWKRIYRLAELMACSVREAAGTVGCLWNQSQDVVKVHGSRDEIIEWASLFGISDELVEKWFSALQKVRFISKAKDGLFKVHGNDIQLETRVANTSRASKGGKALKKKLAETRRLGARLKKASSALEAGLEQASSPSLQGNAAQGSAEQSNAVQTNSKGKRKSNSANSTNASDFIAAYCDRFKLRWGDSPPIQGKDAGIIKRLMKTQSLETFTFYLDAYFSIPDASLVKAKHPLNLFELKLNEVAVFAKSGQFTTHRQAQQADDMASNAMLLKKVREENENLA